MSLVAAVGTSGGLFLRCRGFKGKGPLLDAAWVEPLLFSLLAETECLATTNLLLRGELVKARIFWE